LRAKRWLEWRYQEIEGLMRVREDNGWKIGENRMEERD
jgi:hypothetical protein